LERQGHRGHKEKSEQQVFKVSRALSVHKVFVDRRVLRACKGYREESEIKDGKGIKAFVEFKAIRALKGVKVALVSKA